MPVLIATNHLHELKCVQVNDTGIRVGAAVTIEELKAVLTKESETSSGVPVI